MLAACFVVAFLLCCCRRLRRHSCMATFSYCLSGLCRVLLYALQEARIRVDGVASADFHLRRVLYFLLHCDARA